jgi:hypothetical protein
MQSPRFPHAANNGEEQSRAQTEFGTPEDTGAGAAPPGERNRRATAPSNNRDDLPHDFWFRDNRIFVTHRVSLGCQQMVVNAGNAVRYQVSRPPVDHDLFGSQIRHAATADDQNVARPDCRNHAETGGPEADFAKTANHLGDQFATHC